MKPGDTVICVNADGTAPNMGIQELVEGKEYTIQWRGHYDDPFYEGTYDGIRLVEVRRGVDPVSGKEDKPFKATRFRPVVTTPTVKQKEREVVE